LFCLVAATAAAMCVLNFKYGSGNGANGEQTMQSNDLPLFVCVNMHSFHFISVWEGKRTAQHNTLEKEKKKTEHAQNK